MKTRLRLFIFGLTLTCVVGSLLLTSFPRRGAFAQDAESGAPNVASEPIVKQAVNFAVSPALRDIESSEESTITFRRGRVEANTERPEKNTSPPLSGEIDSEQALSEVTQSPAPEQNLAVVPAAPSFEGISNQDNQNILGGRVFPPDTVGDVGPTQYLQAVNLLFQVYDKATGAELMPPRPVSALFDVLPATSRCRLRDDGDPIVLYDSLADRWFISQFVASPASPSAPLFAQCIAVSQTGDATGAYYVYEFVSPNNKFGDYPKYGVWPNAYYSTVNQFNAAGTAFQGAGVFAYDREKMLRGDPTASYIYFDLEILFPGEGGMLPSDADGLLPPPAGAPNVFATYNANEFINETDSLRLFDFRADFANPAASSFTQRADSPLAVAPFDPLSPSGLDDIEQPLPAPTTARLDAIDDRLMHRLQYRNFGSFEALTVNHTVNAGTRSPGIRPTADQYRAAPRYYQLRRDSPTGNFTVQNQGTFAPADTDERWMGSAALDNQGNLGLGYSVSSLSTFPSIRYTGRLASDPVNTLQSEESLHAGTGVQTNAGSRWGDYSSLNVDPIDDCTFFYTQEYYQTTDRTPRTAPFGANWQTRIGSFKFAECTAPARGTLVVNVTACGSGLPVQGASVTIDGNLFGTTLANGSFTTQLPPGTYTITISAPGFPASTSQTVTVAADGTATVTLCITGVPIIASQGPVGAPTSESCSPPNGAVDPGETVTVNLTLRNNGTASTTNLVATLLPSANVISPSGPQSYGAIPPGGTATRPFTFTAAGDCGDTITLTLALEDNGVSLGTVTYTLSLGAEVTNAPASFANPTAIVLPPAAAPSNGAGPATPYPSNIAVSGLTGTVSKVTVTLNGFNHTFPDDVDVLLVSPSGQKVIVMSDAGGGTPVAGVTLTLDDDAAAPLPDSAPLTSGTFRPSNYAPDETFPAPAPPPPYAGALSAFNGTNPNGTWSLYVFDQFALDSGSIAGGWSISITTSMFVCCGGETAMLEKTTTLNGGRSATVQRMIPAADLATTGRLRFLGVGLSTVNSALLPKVWATAR